MNTGWRTPLLILPLLLLTSCNQKLPVVEFDDVVIAHNYTDTSGLAYGLKGLYVMYGEHRAAKGKLTAGTCLLYSPPMAARFSIKKVLGLFPELVCTKSSEAANRQKL